MGYHRPKDRLLAIPANIKLERKRLRTANALAYYDSELFTVVKSFIANAPGN